MRTTLTVFILCVVAVFAARPNPESPASAGVDQQCHALGSMDFSDVPDAPTQINGARHILNAQDMLEDLPDLSHVPADVVTILRKSLTQLEPLCRVTGYVAPNVGFALVLPDANWNGKFLHLGCGGWCGSSRWFPALCALHPHYACIGTDMGHEGEGGLWLRDNLQAQIDFSHRATHVATLAGKAIIARYYRQSPRKSYFMGCSTGGYQGMTEAQRYPWDFDGIIAGAPDMDEADLAVRGLWLKRHYLGVDGQPVFHAPDIQLLHGAALAHCDRDDGLKDGIISDPAHCRFDPGELLCEPGQHSNCLSALQVHAAKSLYGAPETSSHVALSSRGVLPGSELNWPEELAEVFGDTYFRDLGLPNPAHAWTYLNFDFEHDYPRSGAGVLFNDTNPDLRRFKAAGGKLISYQGGNDAGEIPGAIIDYYETVEKTMGGTDATRDFFRFFVIPGMNHCGGGDGAFAFDYLNSLEAWVERGQAPNVLTGAHIDGLGKFGWIYLKYPLGDDVPVAFTRPVYPYPSYPHYDGKGDPKSALSFRPAGDSPQRPNRRVVPQ